MSNRDKSSTRHGRSTNKSTVWNEASSFPRKREANASGTVPLVRALSKLGLASRTQTQEWIEAGRLSVNGKIIKDPKHAVVPERDRFALDAVEFQQSARLCIVLHKPRGYVTTRSDEKGRKTVFDLLPDTLQTLHAVGRLDMNTSGLLLMTNDTNLSSALTDPANAVPREYVVSVEGKISEESIQQAMQGVQDDDEVLKATKVSVRKLSGRESHLFVTLQEGKNREIRRLFKALGHEVTKLKRIAFGSIKLGELESGKYRELSSDELSGL